MDFVTGQAGRPQIADGATLEDILTLAASKGQLLSGPSHNVFVMLSSSWATVSRYPLAHRLKKVLRQQAKS